MGHAHLTAGFAGSTTTCKTGGMRSGSWSSPQPFLIGVWDGLGVGVIVWRSPATGRWPISTAAAMPCAGNRVSRAGPACAKNIKICCHLECVSLDILLVHVRLQRPGRHLVRLDPLSELELGSWEFLLFSLGGWPLLRMVFDTSRSPTLAAPCHAPHGHPNCRDRAQLAANMSTASTGPLCPARLDDIAGRWPRGGRPESSPHSGRGLGYNGIL